MSTSENTKKFGKGKPITRRKFNQLALGLGATAVSAMALGVNPLWAAPKTAPKRGGHFKIAMADGAASDTLNTSIYSSPFCNSLGWAARNNLIEVGPSGELIPELAEKWEPSPDGMIWRFYLRKGVEFHNGKSLDANDVVASLNLHRGEDTKSGAKTLMKQLKEIKAEGTHTVVMTLNSGNADWPYYMSENLLQIMPAVGDSVDYSGIGTGGYILEYFEPGVAARLKRNPNYWKENAAWFDSVEMLVVLDPSARSSSLATGEVHAIDEVDFTTADRLKKMKGINIHGVTGYRHYTFPMFTDVAPFDDNNVRLALKYAIDREQLLTKVFSGYGVLGNDHPIAPIMRFHADDIPQRTYDPDKARYHLKKAGLDKLDLNLSVSEGAFSGAVDAGTLYQQDAQKAGIKLNLVREPSDGYWSNVWMKKPFCAATWAGRLTEDWMFTITYSDGAKWNDSHWKNERFNKILVEARTVIDTQKRREMYREMQLLVRDEGGVVIPFFTKLVFGTRDAIGVPEKLAGNRELDGNRFAERWWFV